MICKRVARWRHIGRVKLKRLCACDELIKLGLRRRVRATAEPQLEHGKCMGAHVLPTNVVVADRWRRDRHRAPLQHAELRQRLRLEGSLGARGVERLERAGLMLGNDG
jgi:hypothetical protein